MREESLDLLCNGMMEIIDFGNSVSAGGGVEDITFLAIMLKDFFKAWSLIFNMGLTNSCLKSLIVT